MFQSTPPRGKRLAHRPRAHRSDVSIHAPAREATRAGILDVPVMWFQSTPPRGKRLGATTRTRLVNCFNPRPRAGSDSLRYDKRSTTDGFNPRPRAGSDIQAVKRSFRKNVSIHAPAREATIPISEPTGGAVFQSTPPRGKRLPLCLPVLHQRLSRGFNPRPRAGSDPSPTVVSEPKYCFNPRPRAGSDLGPEGREPAHGHAVSIHAPAREATTATRTFDVVPGRFNPRPRAGSDCPEAP